MSSYAAPTQEQVREALRRIPTLQLRRAFFEGLKNPMWLAPLAAEGAFARPPGQVGSESEGMSDAYWPEIDYVIRAAPEASRTAVDVLLELQNSENSWIRRAVFAVGARVPASEAARLKPVLKKWLTSGFGWRTDPREMVDFTINLLSGGERRVGEWVANALFRPGPKGDSRKPDLMITEYWYAAELPRVVDALGPQALPLVLGWLVEYEKVTGQPDGWSFSRPTIQARSRDHNYVEDTLIDAVRDLSVVALQTDVENTVAKLLAANMVLTRRIAIFAVGEALAASVPGSDHASLLVSSGSGLLFDQRSNDEHCRIEFAQLARVMAQRSPESLKPLVQFIDDGPRIGTVELRARLARDSDTSEADVDVRLAEFIEHWKHAWLSAIGADSLPAQLRTTLADLDARNGLVERPLRPPVEITSWTGPNSPRTQEEMAVMTPAELIGHLESWHDTGDGWGPEPSHEGQGRELLLLLTSNPERIAGIPDLVERLRPTYLRAILSGWEAAFKAGQELDWPQVYQTARAVIEHAHESDLPPEGGDFDDDPDFGWSKKAAIELIDELVKPTEPSRVPAVWLEQLADLLFSSVLDEAAWREYSSGAGESGMDPLTLSINWQWPTMIRGLVSLVSHGASVTWASKSRVTLLTELDRPDPWGASRAVIGENLARLLNADVEWTEQQLESMFGSAVHLDRNQQIALSTAMAIHHYHQRLYRLLSPSMLAALSSSEPLVEGWSQDSSSLIQRIGEWAIKTIIFGHADWTDPVVNCFFTTAEAVTRGASLGHIGWELMHATEISGDVRDEFARVWDSRIEHVESVPSDSAELREFYWVVKSGKFDPVWWLPRLKKVLALDPAVVSERFMIGKELATASDVDPRTALDLAKLLLTGAEARSLAAYELSRNAIPMVIARAIGAEDPALRADATTFMNELGAAGDLGLAKQVDLIVSGQLSQADVEE